MQERGKKCRQVIWKVIRTVIILVVVILALLFLLAMGSQSVTGEILDPSFREIYWIDGETYALHREKVFVRFERYELRRFGDDTTLHRFPLGQFPWWSEDAGVFYYLKGKTVYQWDPVTDQEEKVYTITRPEHEKGWKHFIRSGSYRLRGVWSNYLLLCRNDGMPVLVDLIQKRGIFLEDVKDYTSFGFMATDEYLLFEANGKAVKTFSLETGEVLPGTLPLGAYDVRFVDHKENVVLLIGSMSGEETLFWYNAAEHDLRNLTARKMADGTTLMVSKDIIFARMIWDDVVYVERIENNSFALNRVDEDGNHKGSWQLPFCEEVKVLRADGDRLLLITATPSANYRQILSYYQLTEDGRLELVYEWDSVSNHALNTCHVIIAGDQVISGCPTEPELIRFPLK